MLTAAPSPELLRVVICGSVDDGKSTMIGRLLDEAGLLPEDAPPPRGADGAPDHAAVLDGLEAERRQGITIDIAWRNFATRHRRFRLADAPGHEQYTRNMANGAAGADVAVLLVDVAGGLRSQTRRHALIASLMGVRHIVLAVNKMDLLGFDAGSFIALAASFRDATATLGFADITAIPLCARDGDNVIAAGTRMPWYAGRPLLAHLEALAVPPPPPGPFRMPVQATLRHGDLRFHTGTVASGSVRPGDAVRIYAAAVPDGRPATIATLLDGAAMAGEGDAASLMLAEPADVERGDVIAAGQLTLADRLEADLIWLNETPLIPGRSHLLRLGTAQVAASVTRIAGRIDLDGFRLVSADSLAAGDVARVSLVLAAAIPATSFAEGPALGGFVLIDRATAATVAVGMVRTLAVAETAPKAMIDQAARALALGQRPAVLWFTGLSGAGKSTVAALVERRLHGLGRHTARLDGDDLRHGLNRDLRFSEADRVENIRRAGEAARLLVEAGLIVLASFISPYRADRDAARERFGPGEFIEIFVDTPPDECRRRDPKGLWRRADAGELADFTGVSAPYEAPLQPELHLLPDTLEAQVAEVIGYLTDRDRAAMC